MKVQVRFIIVGNINMAIKVFLCITQYFYMTDNDLNLNNTHRAYCYVISAIMA